MDMSWSTLYLPTRITDLTIADMDHTDGPPAMDHRVEVLSDDQSEQSYPYPPTCKQKEAVYNPFWWHKQWDTHINSSAIHFKIYLKAETIDIFCLPSD